MIVVAKKLLAICVLLLFCCTARAEAQTFKMPVVKRPLKWTARYNREEDEDLGIWPQSIINYNRGKFLFEFDCNPRIMYRMTRLDQLFLRTFIGYRFKPWLTAWFGCYPWAPTFQPVYVSETRTLQQVAVDKAFGKLAVSLRARLEQRYIEHLDHAAWRLRVSPRVNYFIDERKSIYLFASEEPFINLNNDGPAIRKCFAQNRVFAGLGFPITNRLRMEVAYLNQYIRRRFANTTVPNRDNHIVFLNVVGNF